MNFIGRTCKTVFTQLMSSVARTSCRPYHAIVGQRVGQKLFLENDLSLMTTRSRPMHTVLTPAFGLAEKNKILLPPAQHNFEIVRTYKSKTVLKLRCSSCYFIRRKGRLFVECSAKPRHKQMQRMNKQNLYREDYSKGNVTTAVWWYWKKNRWYQDDRTNFDKSKWLGEKIASI